MTMTNHFKCRVLQSTQFQKMYLHLVNVSEVIAGYITICNVLYAHQGLKYKVLQLHFVSSTYSLLLKLES